MTSRILLVEDDPVSRDLLAALLTSRGYDVDTADDAFGALRIAQDERYDLVFVDYHLPEMDGYALARLMRTLGEKSNTDLKMVAITADRFGLAARRGADAIFDAMLSKPIEPEALYTFVDGMIGPASAGSDLDSFLAEPSPQDAHSAAQVLWRVRGLDRLPTAAAFPEPSAAERASLEYCFRLVEPDKADCLVLLRSAGLPALEALRATGQNFLQPLLTLDPADEALGDVAFKVGDGESWSAAAAAIGMVPQRRADLAAGVEDSCDMDTRLLAYLHVADRALILRRDGFGRTSVPYTGGFAPAAIIEAVKRLAAKGSVVARPNDCAIEGVRELAVTLTAKGVGTIADVSAVMAPAG